VSFYVSTATFFLLHCDEWDHVVALPRHKFVTGATLLQLGRHMQFDVNIRLYEHRHEQVKIRKKRWNNKEIKKFYWKYICKQKVRKKGGGESVPRPPVSAERRVAPPSQPVFPISPSYCVFSGEATKNNFIIFGVTWSGFNPKIHRTRGDHATHNTTDAIPTNVGKSSVLKYYKN
jgi:hypothetical protein